MKNLEILRILAKGLTHDFNDLIASIYGYIELAQDQQKDSIFLKKALSCTSRAQGLTDKLSIFARTEDIDKETIAINKIIKDLTNYKITDRLISVHYDISDDLWFCYGNKIQISQVIENVFLNAVQSIDGNGSIYIKVENVSAKLFKKDNNFIDYIKLTIQDTGKGMSKETLNHMFEPFFTTKDNSHGLGLALSYSIIKNHKGKIKISSELSKGTLVSIYLPVSSIDFKSMSYQESIKHQGEGEVIILDDNDDIQFLMGAYLESFGYKVKSKHTGQEILMLVKDFYFDQKNLKAIFLDLSVPNGLGGKEIIHDLRNLVPDIPIFAISANPFDPVLNYPKEYNFTSSLKKPFSKSELEIFLNKYLT